MTDMLSDKEDEKCDSNDYILGWKDGRKKLLLDLIELLQKHHLLKEEKGG